MPLFRFINPPAGLEDASYLFDSNPDPKRYEEVEKPKTRKPSTVPADAPAESETEAN